MCVEYVCYVLGTMQGSDGNDVYLMYGNTSEGVGVGGVLISGSFYMCPTVECILRSENVYTAHCMKQ